MRMTRQKIADDRSRDEESLKPEERRKVAICRISGEDDQPNPSESQCPRKSTLSNELDRSQRALYQAQDRIAELTRAQITLSGTVERLAEQASTDALTGLNNRRHFTDALNTGFQESKWQALPLSIIMIDVDSFKSYNDVFGHAAGDQVLWVVAKILLRTSAGNQTLVRYGGEEFAILLPGTDASEAMEIAERQRSLIESFPWTSRPITASFGISTLDPTTDESGVMLEQADRALYHSKSRGRNRVTHHRWLENPLADRTGNAPQENPSKTFDSPTSHEGQLGANSPEPSDLVDAPFLTNLSGLSHWNSPREMPTRYPITDTSWDALERFLQVLQVGSQSSDLYQETLSAIREGTESEIVFLCNDQTGEVLGAVGDHVPSPQWYVQLTRKLADELPTGGLWKPSDASKKGLLVVPEPASAIVLPIKSPRSTWLIALCFRESQNLLAHHLRVARVIWQLQIDHHRHDRVQDKLKETLFGVVRCLSAAIDAKDPYTCGHSERVARIAVRLGEEMGLSKGETSDLYLAGLLHDLGKIGIRDSVLCSEGPLTPEEYLHMQEHPVTGERIIANVSRLAYLRPGVRGHHERFDGSGYPDGLKGETIPLMARILAVADACDAMMSVRRYRAALSEARIAEIFEDGAGTQWDPRIVQHFLNCRHELFAVIQRGLGQSVYFAVERAVGSGESLNSASQSLNRKNPAASPNRSL